MLDQQVLFARPDKPAKPHKPHKPQRLTTSLQRALLRRAESGGLAALFCATAFSNGVRNVGEMVVLYSDFSPLAPASVRVRDDVIIGATRVLTQTPLPLTELRPTLARFWAFPTLAAASAI